MSRDEHLLDDLAPDVLILDEAHTLKNVASSAWGRRVARYLNQGNGGYLAAAARAVRRQSLAEKKAKA